MIDNHVVDCSVYTSHPTYVMGRGLMSGQLAMKNDQFITVDYCNKTDATVEQKKCVSDITSNKND